MPQTREFDYELAKIRRANSDQESMWDGFTYGRPNFNAVYSEDFYTYTAGDWTVTETDASATEALTDAQGGILLLTNTAADNDLIGMQLGACSATPASGRTIWYEILFLISDATQLDYLVGLHVTDTSPIASAPANGIWFRKDDGDTNIDCTCMNTSVASELTAVATASATLYVKLGFKVTGTQLCEFWVNDVKKGSITTQIPTVVLRPSFCLQNGEAVAKTMKVDYMVVASTR